MTQSNDKTESVTLDDNERQRCEVWTRVMGYHRPVSAFNPGKHQEHDDRLHFEEQVIKNKAAESASVTESKVTC